MSQSLADNAPRTSREDSLAGIACDYCHLPVSGSGASHGEPVYCCFGCRIAAEITGQSGQQGAVHWTLVRLGLAIFLSLNVMMFTMALWSQDIYDARAAGSGPLAESLADLFRYLCLVLSLPVLWLLGGPLLDNAWAMWRRGAAGTDLLILLGVAASYVYSAISVFRGAGHVYFEVGCAVLVMVTLGRWLEATGKLKTTAALDALEKLLPREVRVMRLVHDVTLDLEQLQVGDQLHVLAGERIAADGRVVAGCAGVDQQMLTGESRPVTKRLGDGVLGGSLNLDGDLLIEVMVPPSAGSFARLIEMVRCARLTKGRYQRLADRVAGWFLFGVVIVACLAFAYHTWRGGLDRGLLSSLAVLLIACPCALGLATPMAVWAALGAASHAGVLFRHGEALERLATIRAVRFDKTGTLTTGTPHVEELICEDAADRGEVVSRAAHLAAASTHVFSRAIVHFLNEGQRSARASEHVGTTPGRGVFAQFANDAAPTRLGSARWLEDSGLKLGGTLARAVADARQHGESFSAIGWDDRVRALFIFSETLRTEAREALAGCAQMHCDVAVLTGDEPARGERLSAELDIPVIAGLLPENKVAALGEARRRFGPVAMIGDGINDAPALAASDLGIAMGCGADVSRESAAVCLLSDDLLRVPWAIGLAQRTVRVIRQNLFWAFAYNTLGIALAAAGWLNPAWAALAMVLSSSFVVTNSLRLGKELHVENALPAVLEADENVFESRYNPVREVQSPAPPLVPMP